MSFGKIENRISTASRNEIFKHLIKCSSLFKPALSSYIDIVKYAEKLHTYAVTFEAWDNNILIGLIATYFNNQVEKSGFISVVSVLEEYHSKGIATGLLLNTFKYAAENNFCKIILEVNSQNINAIKLYKKHGFVIVKQDNEKITMNCVIGTK